ncbi:hypothetical protein FE257_000251 [Aspergillus nanangensis]|uniref:Xylanolytic transcriptional activator regulatory domain-containing protein n=1 Tax=Aspergillus nanangensis TaxID=2582783 RepID=A0AAD4GZR7_ASPNN|nr:hypothetical protein FE257_000251 [Aspergillus nanangensis]
MERTSIQCHRAGDCDDQAGSCRNCIKSASECMLVDPLSRKLYSRSYVSELQRKVKQLEGALNPDDHKSPVSLPTATPRPFSLLETGQENPPGIRSANNGTTPGSINGPYHGTGSVISIARLVAAAVSAKATSQTFSVVLSDTSALQSFQDDYHNARPVDKQDVETSQALLASYLNGFHLLHPFLQRSSLEELFSHVSNVDPGSQLSPSERFRYFMVCAIGALRLVRSGSHDVPAINYYATAMIHEQQALNVEGIEQVQNILLILVFGVLYETGISNKWDLARLAIRSCIENNLHRRTTSVTPMQDQMRRRVFWTTYILERQASITVGRPFAISDRDISIEPPIDADDEFICFPDCIALQEARGLSEVSMQVRHIKIRQFSSRIQHILSRKYATTTEWRSLELNEVLTELDEWRASIPPMLSGQNIYQTESWVDLNYHKERLSCLKALAFPPSPGSSDFASEHIRLCLVAAIGVVQSYVGLTSCDERVMNWMCVQDMLSSGFTALYCLHLVCNVQGLGSSYVPDSSLVGHEMITESLDAIATCSTFLSHISGRWKTVMKQERLFSTLAAEIRRQVDHWLVASSGNSTQAGEFSVASNWAPGQEMSTRQMAPRDPALTDGDAYSLGADSLMNLDFDNLDWNQIFALGQDNLTLADVGL